MIDNFSLLLTHGLLLFAAWRLLSRADLDHEPPAIDREAGTTLIDSAKETPADA